VHATKALLVVVVLEPLSLGLLEAPGLLGADLVTGEGMGLGTGLNFGGPGLGVFGAARKNVWQMPGRLVGETQDDRGRRGFVLTMSSREQHIRRARATSNICTNEGLCSLAAAIHLSLLGKTGFTELSRINAANAHAAMETLTAAAGIERAFAAPFFNEFAIRVRGDLAAKLDRLADQGLLGGVPLERFYPELGDRLLVYVNELADPDHLARLARGLAS